MTRIDSYLTMKVLKVQGKTLRDGGNQRQNAGNRYANYCKGPKNFSSSVEENRKSEDGSVIATQKTLGFHKFNICSFEYLYVVPPKSLLCCVCIFAKVHIVNQCYVQYSTVSHLAGT